MGRVNLDLDALAPEPKSVRLAGREWLLPADIPLTTVARLTKFAAEQGELDAAQLPGELVDTLLELFRVHQPDLEKLPPISARQVFTMLDRLYQLGFRLEEEGEETGGPGKQAGGTQSTTRRAAKPASSSS